jgi:hypothetical protein
VPSVDALLNYMTITEVGHFRRFFHKLGFFVGFFYINIIIIAGTNSAAAAMGGAGAVLQNPPLCSSTRRAPVLCVNELKN